MTLVNDQVEGKESSDEGSKLKSQTDQNPASGRPLLSWVTWSELPTPSEPQVSS